jgi:hypothetical protein
MFIFWGTATKDKNLEEGYFDCPDCKSLQPCTLRAVSRYETLYFFATKEIERLKEYVVCGGCDGTFDSASYRTSRNDPAPKPVTWGCFKCKHVNPNHTYKCLKCGYSLI